MTIFPRHFDISQVREISEVSHIVRSHVRDVVATRTLLAHPDYLTVPLAHKPRALIAGRLSSELVFFSFEVACATQLFQTSHTASLSCASRRWRLVRGYAGAGAGTWAGAGTGAGARAA